MFRKVGALIFLVLFSLNICGCTAILAGAAGAGGTALWLKGKLIQEVDVSFEDTISAVKSALESLNLKVAKETRTADITKIKSQYHDGRTVWVDVRNISQVRSRIEVRVGAVSDEEAAREILKRIIQYL